MHAEGARWKDAQKIEVTTRRKSGITAATRSVADDGRARVSQRPAATAGRWLQAASERSISMASGESWRNFPLLPVARRASTYVRCSFYFRSRLAGKGPRAHRNLHSMQRTRARTFPHLCIYLKRKKKKKERHSLARAVVSRRVLAFCCCYGTHISQNNLHRQSLESMCIKVK